VTLGVQLKAIVLCALILRYEATAKEGNSLPANTH